MSNTKIRHFDPPYHILHICKHSNIYRNLDILHYFIIYYEKNGLRYVQKISFLFIHTVSVVFSKRCPSRHHVITAGGLEPAL